MNPLNQAFVSASSSTEANTRFGTPLSEPLTSSPAELGAFMKSELAKYAQQKMPTRTLVGI